jgi:hypothetical protein
VNTLFAKNSFTVNLSPVILPNAKVARFASRSFRYQLSKYFRRFIYQVFIFQDSRFFIPPNFPPDEKRSSRRLEKKNASGTSSINTRYVVLHSFKLWWSKASWGFEFCNFHKWILITHTTLDQLLMISWLLNSSVRNIRHQKLLRICQ